MPGFLVALLAIYSAVLGVDAIEDVPTTQQLYESLIGGEETDLGYYPEMTYIINENRGRCSAVIIGDRTVLTAAHCTTQGGKVHNYFASPYFGKFEAECSISKPWTDGRIDYDFALCKTKNKIPGAKPATLGRSILRDNAKTIMSGFGCTSSDGSGGNIAILKTGASSVGIAATNSYNYYYAFDNPILCFGDSGGPMYAHMTDPATQRHVIHGVNSRTNLVTLSLLAATDTRPALSFIRAWAKKNKVKICGINKKCKIAGYTPMNSASNMTISEVEDDAYDGDDDGL